MEKTIITEAASYVTLDAFAWACARIAELDKDATAPSSVEMIVPHNLLLDAIKVKQLLQVGCVGPFLRVSSPGTKYWTVETGEIRVRFPIIRVRLPIIEGTSV